MTSVSGVSVFEFQDFIAYLREKIRSFPNKGHGTQRKIAAAIFCQSAYVSRVLKGFGRFSLEQASGISRFFGHSPEEEHYFLLLLQKDTAGNFHLKNYFQKQLEEALNKRLVLKNRFTSSRVLRDEDQIRYFSQWYYSAVHVGLTIPELRTAESLARYLGLSKQKVSEILGFLVGCGLGVEEGGVYNVGSVRLHLGADSPMIEKSHMNWRMQTMRLLERGRAEDLHYSSVVSLSRADLLKIRAELVDRIESIKKTIRESKEEELACFSIDFFRLGQSD